jgi:hypothetical protein
VGDQQQAIQTVESPAPIQSIAERVFRGDVELVTAKVTIPKHLQYEVATGARKQGPDGKWYQPTKVGLTADGYDWVNRVVGVQIIVPKTVHDELGREQPNPIHRRDYVFLRIVGVWWNDLGQMTSYQEDIEVDFKALYQEDRLNRRWYTGKGDDREQHQPELVMRVDKAGNPVTGEDGLPAWDLKMPMTEELKSLQRLFNLRNFGLRYAYTVGKNRILKTATGIRSLPVDHPRNVTITVTGMRDGLTPEMRADRAKEDALQMYGDSQALGEGQTLSNAELEEAGLSEATEEVSEVGVSDEEPQATPDEDPGRPFSAEEVDEALAGSKP